MNPAGHATVAIPVECVLIDHEGRARREDAKNEAPGFSVFWTGGLLDYNAWGIDGSTPGAEPRVLDRGQRMWLPTGGAEITRLLERLPAVAPE